MILEVDLRSAKSKLNIAAKTMMNLVNWTLTMTKKIGVKAIGTASGNTMTSGHVSR